MIPLLEKLEPFFNYGVITSNLWRELLIQAKKHFKISFDLENNDTFGKKERRIITFPTDTTEVSFKCHMSSAGGDWEYPVLYFRCQVVRGSIDYLKDGKRIAISQFGKNGGCFIFIPNKKQGNHTLIPGRKDSEYVARNYSDFDKRVDPDNDKRECWKSLKNYLFTMVQKTIEYRRAERSKDVASKPGERVEDS